MDLGTLDPSRMDQPCTLQLVSPVDGSPLFDEESGQPVTIDLVSADSPDYRKRLHRVTNDRIKRQIRGSRVKQQPITSEEQERDTIELLVTCTRGWSHIVMDGEELDFTPDNARKVYAIRWIREQVDDFINDVGNFLGN